MQNINSVFHTPVLCPRDSHSQLTGVESWSHHRIAPNVSNMPRYTFARLTAEIIFHSSYKCLHNSNTWSKPIFFYFQWTLYTYITLSSHILAVWLFYDIKSCLLGRYLRGQTILAATSITQPREGRHPCHSLTHLQHPSKIHHLL